MNKKEQRIANTMSRLCRGELSNREASKDLGISIRQLQRKKVAYKQIGIESVVHKLKLHPSNTGYGTGLKEQIVGLYLAEYAGWNFHHFNDALEDDYGVILSDTYIYNTLTSYGIVSPKQKKHRPKGHPPRARRENAGELIQVDASNHAWIELGDECTKKYHLHGAIDDATGIVLSCVLQEQETIYGYQLMLAEIIKNYGIPECFYTDYRTVFQTNKKLSLEEELSGKEVGATKFAGMLERLGVNIISTLVPQAKGRIERLWETLQDRLVKELKKKHITNMDEANTYIRETFLPRYNARFASTIDENRNHFVSVQPDFDYNKELSLISHQRVCHGTYIQSSGETYAIIQNGKPTRLNVHLPVDVYIFLDGTKHLLYKDTWYDLEKIKRVELPKRPKMKQTTRHTQTEINASKAHIPAKDHPWRQNMMLRKNTKLVKQLP